MIGAARIGVAIISEAPATGTEHRPMLGPTLTPYLSVLLSRAPPPHARRLSMQRVTWSDHEKLQIARHAAAIQGGLPRPRGAAAPESGDRDDAARSPPQARGDHRRRPGSGPCSKETFHDREVIGRLERVEGQYDLKVELLQRILGQAERQYDLKVELLQRILESGGWTARPDRPTS